MDESNSELGPVFTDIGIAIEEAEYLAEDTMKPHSIVVGSKSLDLLQVVETSMARSRGMKVLETCNPIERFIP